MANREKERAAARDRKAESEAVRLSRISVDREEYAALCALRDGCYEDMRAANIKMGATVTDLLAANAALTSRLTDQDMRLSHLRVCLDRSEKRELALMQSHTKQEEGKS